MSATFPLFTISGLESGKILKMIVYAANGKGRSEAVLLEGFTLKMAEKQTGKGSKSRSAVKVKSNAPKTDTAADNNNFLFVRRRALPKNINTRNGSNIRAL